MEISGNLPEVSWPVLLDMEVSRPCFKGKDDPWDRANMVRILKIDFRPVSYPLFGFVVCHNCSSEKYFLFLVVIKGFCCGGGRSRSKRKMLTNDLSCVANRFSNKACGYFAPCVTFQCPRVIPPTAIPPIHRFIWNLNFPLFSSPSFGPSDQRWANSRTGKYLASFLSYVCTHISFVSYCTFPGV